MPTENGMQLVGDGKRRPQVSGIPRLRSNYYYLLADLLLVLNNAKTLGTPLVGFEQLDLISN